MVHPLLLLVSPPCLFLKVIFPFVLSGPETQVLSKAGKIPMVAAVVGAGRRGVAVGKFLHQGFFSSSLRHSNSVPVA